VLAALGLEPRHLRAATSRVAIARACSLANTRDINKSASGARTNNSAITHEVMLAKRSQHQQVENTGTSGYTITAISLQATKSLSKAPFRPSSERSKQPCDGDGPAGSMPVLVTVVASQRERLMQAQVHASLLNQAMKLLQRALSLALL